MVLYPIVGHITDRNGATTPRTTFQMFLTTSFLTLIGFIALTLPLHTAWPGLIPWALGHGAAPLLLVVLVARILPADLVPLGLGMHKALETAASTGFQTLAGLYLDYAKRTVSDDDEDTQDEEAAHSLLVIFAAINVLQIIGAFVLWRSEARRRHALAAPGAADYERVPEEQSALGLSVVEDRPTVVDADDFDSDTESIIEELLKSEDEPQSGLARSGPERARARISFRLCLAFITAVWILFIAVAWRKL
jgi:hypothetical protein